MQNKILADHVGNGVWDFTCWGHDPDPYATRGISSPKHAIGVMKQHVDKEHPGERFKLIRMSEYSSFKSYTGNSSN